MLLKNNQNIRWEFTVSQYDRKIPVLWDDISTGCSYIRYFVLSALGYKVS